MASDERPNAAHRLLQRLGPWHCSVKRWASQIPTEPALVWLNEQALPYTSTRESRMFLLWKRECVELQIVHWRKSAFLLRYQADIVTQKTYQELDSEATKLAVALKTRYGCKPRDRLILCYPPGLDFVVAFVACQMLGAVAVPLNLPRARHRNQNVHNFLSLVRKARALRFLLTSSACKHSLLAGWHLETADGATLQWVFSDELIQDADEDCFKSPTEFSSYTKADPTGIAFMQFSSGSTGTPKGCLITQAGFLHNIHHNWYASGIYCSRRKKAIYDVPLEEYADFTKDFQNLVVQRWGHRLRFVSWLPVTHDMGLVGMIGVPLFFGCTAYFMSPMEFLRTPSAWLEAFSRHHCSFTAAPDFAYALAARKVPDIVLGRLSFRKAFAFINGAEPIRQRTLELFASKFGECGFESWMMCPSYGLAENTVGVTGRGRDGLCPRAPRILQVNREKLFPGDKVCQISCTPSSNDTAAHKSIVGCGCMHGDVIVKIVHPETLDELPEWHVGEVWVSSPSCALAYFDDPAATTVTFEGQISRAHQIENAGLKYLRTGDLGFLGDGELYITGRLKNVLIIRGQNYYLQDFEEVVENCSHIRKGCVMAFPLNGDKDSLESLGVAAEVERSVTLLEELQDIAEQVKRSISQTFQLSVHSLWLTEAGTLPKTTSGKPRRFAARSMLEKSSCQGVLYSSNSRQPDDAPDRPLPSHTQCCKKCHSRNEDLGDQVERGERIADLSYIRNNSDPNLGPMTSTTSPCRSEGKRHLVERENFYLGEPAWVERVVFECFREVFDSCDFPLDTDTPLGAFNLDSLSAVELAAALTRKLNIDVEPFVFFECPTIGSVVTAVKDVVYEEGRAKRPPARQLIDSMKQEPQYEIYITGVACKLPMGCDEPANFWARLLQKDHFIGAPPPGRYPRFCGHFPPSTPLKVKEQLQDWQGGFINDIALFDNSYFGISAAEAAAMDPQQRLLLMQAVEALTSRGDCINTRRTGVYVGCCSEDWQRLNSTEGSQAFTATTQASCMLANRISYNLNFTGPSVTIDTACSSSLVALHCAWQEMTTGGARGCNSVDTAVVAAVNLMMVFDSTLALRRSGFLSPTYRCRTFDAAADGFVRSEGAAAVVLEKIWRGACETVSAGSPASQDDADRREKPSASNSFVESEVVSTTTPVASGGPRENTENKVLAQQAEDEEVTLTTGSTVVSAAYTQEEHDAAPYPSQRLGKGSVTPKTSQATSRNPRKAWCRLLATAVVHGGKTSSVTAPCRASQEELYKKCISLSGATPDDICYIETHGTGTALGDPIEVAAIVNVFKSNTFPRSSPLILGAVKTNLGHLEGAAGMAGLLKCVFCLAHRKVPANLHLKTLNPYIDFQQLPVVLPCKTVPLTFGSNSRSGGATQCSLMEATKGNRFGCTTPAGSSGTTDAGRTLGMSIVTSLGFGGTYAQAVLQSLPSNDAAVEVNSISQETPNRYPWKLKRFDHQSRLLSDVAPPPPPLLPACLWRVAWKSIALDDSEENKYCMSWRASSNRHLPWLLLSFEESNGAYWKTLGLRDVHAVVHTLSADVSEESLQCLLQSKAWQAILFVDGMQVYNNFTAVDIFLLFLRVIPLCGRLLSKTHPCCKMLLLTRGSQLVPAHTSLSLINREDAPPYAAGMLGFTRACRVELSYLTEKSAPLYFIDLDPVSAVNSSVNALAAILPKLKADEVDLVMRQGKVYVPRLWFAGPLSCDAVRLSEKRSSEIELRKAVSLPLQGEEVAVTTDLKTGCPLSALQNHSTVTENETEVDRQVISSCGEGLAPCACRVRLMSVCTDSIRCAMDGQAESSDVLVGCSGIVVAVGKHVQHIKIGDAVCGFASSPLGKKPHAISITCSHLLQPIPPSFSFEAAAAIPTQLAQILRTANLGSHHDRESSSLSPHSQTTNNISLLDTEESNEKPLMDDPYSDKNFKTNESPSVKCLREPKLANDACKPNRIAAGTGLQQHGRATCSKVERTQVPTYGCSNNARCKLQYSTHPGAGDGRRRSGEEECAFQKQESTDDAAHQRAHGEKQDSSISCTRVIERDKMTSGDTTMSHSECPPVDFVIVDGSGAGLTAAIYFLNNGYDVIGVPVSVEQQQALEALNIRVLSAAESSVETEEDDTASGVRLTVVEFPTAESDVGLEASFESIAALSGSNTTGATAPGTSALSAVKPTSSWAADNGTGQQDAPLAAAQSEEINAPARTTAAEKAANACVSEKGPSQIQEKATVENPHRQSSPAKQSGVFVASTEFHCGSAFRRVFYCTLRSQESVERLLPLMVSGSIIYDFSVSSTSREIAKRIHSQLNGVTYRKGVVCHPFKDARSNIVALGNALRDACDVLREQLSCYSSVKLHVFLDRALDQGAAFQEASDFTDRGTHAGNVVCTYANPVLHVPSVFDSSPASNHTENPYTSPVISSKDACATSEGTTGTEGKLLSSPGKSVLHTRVLPREGREVCDQQHNKLFTGSADEKRKGFFATANSLGENVLLSVEERRNASYIVSGDPRGLSAAVARWLVEEGALYVVLLCEENTPGQTEEDSDWKWLQATNTATRAITLTCSLRSKESIQNALRQIREELHFPPLRGIIHVPCDAQPELTSNADSAVNGSRFVLEQKALAAWNLHYALDDLQMEGSLQFFVLFSGISGLFGSLKREATCAANTTLDMLACYRSSQGLSGLSIQWASWLADTTRAPSSQSRAAALACECEPLPNAWLNKGGITGIPDGLRALRQILTLYIYGQIGAVVACFGAGPTLTGEASTRDGAWIPKPAASLSKQRVQTLADSICPPSGTLAASVPVTGDDNCSEYKDVLYEMVYKEVCTSVGFYVALEKGQTLRADKTLSSLGMDSLTAAELKYELQSRFHVEFDSQMMPQQATIETIANSIFGYLYSQLGSSFPDGPHSIKSINTRDSIAVVSMALRLPGGCFCPSTFWGMLLAGTDCSREMHKLGGPTKEDFMLTHTQRKSYPIAEAAKACYLDRADAFDSDFFAVSLPEALAMGRQARLLLEVAYEALFNINLRDRVPQSGSPVAVYATGSASCEETMGEQETFYKPALHAPQFRNAQHTVQQSPTSFTRQEPVPVVFRSQESLPCLVSYLLSLSGMSVCVSAGGASSLSALCLAADHLGTNPDVEAALVGAVRLLPVELHNSSPSEDYRPRADVSNTGSCCTRARTDDPFKMDNIEGEGAVVVVLQKQRVAERSANPVLAIIRGRSMTQMKRRDTAAKGEEDNCTAAVRSVLDGALADAGVKRSDVAVVDVAGVGFANSHQPEWEALAQIYGKARSTSHEFPVVIGSVNGNVGCLREAAGLAGFLKVVLMLAQSRPSSGDGCLVIPPSLCLHQICRSMRNIATDGCGGLLFPSKRLVRRLARAATPSAEGHPRPVGSGFNASEEKYHAEPETLFTAEERNAQEITGRGTTLPVKSLGHRHEARSRQLVAMPRASTSSSPEACSGDTIQTAVLRYKPEEKCLGGVTASTPSGFVVHLLVEGAASTLDPAVAFTEAPMGKNNAQRLPTYVVRDVPADGTGYGADRATVGSCSASTAADSAAVPSTAVGCPNAVGNGKRCLWLFPNDYTNLLYCGRPLYFTSQIFAQELDRCSELMRKHLPTSLRQLLYPTCEAELLASEKFLDQPHVAVLSLFALQWSLANYLRQTAKGRSIGVTGVGVGETVAAAVAGLLSLDEAINLVMELGNTMHSHTHATDVQSSAVLIGEKVSSEQADAPSFSMQSSFFQSHMGNIIDYGLSTDGEQTNRSDCFSLYDGTDGSCRSLFWKNDIYRPDASGRQRTQQEQAGFGFASLSMDFTEQSGRNQYQQQQAEPLLNQVSALPAAPSTEKDGGNPFFQEQAATVETPSCHSAAYGRFHEMLKEKSSLPADMEVSGSLALSRSPAPRTAAVEAVTSTTAHRVFVGQDGIPCPSTASANMVRTKVLAETSASVPEGEAGLNNGTEVTTDVEPEQSRMRQYGSNHVQHGRRGCCCLPTGRRATLPSYAIGESRMCDRRPLSPTPTMRRRAGSLVDLKVTDIYQHSLTPSCRIPSPSPSSLSELITDSINRSKPNVDDFLRSMRRREGDQLRDDGRPGSRINRVVLPSLPQAFTPTPRERMTSLQYVKSTHTKTVSHTIKTGRLVSSDCLPPDKRGSYFDRQSGDQPPRDTLSLNVNPGRVSDEASLQESKLCNTPTGRRTPLRNLSVSHVAGGTGTPAARSSLIYTVSGRDCVLASSQEKTDTYPRNFPTSNAGTQGFSKARPHCLPCERIRSIVGKISMKHARCVFLSAAVGSAAPERLVRDPLYWCSTPPRKLRLRTTVKAAKKVLRTAAVVLIGPPAADLLHPASLLKLAKHVEILRFTGRSDSLEAILPFELPASRERAVTVCTDIVLRVPHAAPCWKHVDMQPLRAYKTFGVRLPSRLAKVPRHADQTTRRKVQGHERDSVARTRAAFSE